MIVVYTACNCWWIGWTLIQDNFMTRILGLLGLNKLITNQKCVFRKLGSGDEWTKHDTTYNMDRIILFYTAFQILYCSACNIYIVLAIK